MQKHVAVIGAGIVGVSTAIWLQRAGVQVTLIDKEGPAAGTSYGNAGVLAAASIVPVSVPGLLPKVPGMLFNKNKPLFLKWSYLPRAIPFLMKFLYNGRTEKVTEISRGLTQMLHDCADQHLALAKGTPAEQYVTKGDYLFGYTNRAAFEADAYAWGLRKENGYTFEELDAAQLAAYDPALAGRFGFAVRCPDHGRVSDPGKYVIALADHFQDHGGTLQISEVTDIGDNGTVTTNLGQTDFDDVVVTSGIWSNSILKNKVPMESERGYHMEFINPSIIPQTPIMVATGKFVLTPMDGRLRSAGVVEFGGLNAKPSQAPFDLLKRQTLAIFPELEYDSIETWMGHRPSTSDSLPVIGKVNDKNIWAGFGHQHIGLSGGPKTGRWLAQMISGQTPNEDLSAFLPTRFT